MTGDFAHACFPDRRADRLPRSAGPERGGRADVVGGQPARQCVLSTLPHRPSAASRLHTQFNTLLAIPHTHAMSAHQYRYEHVPGLFHLSTWDEDVSRRRLWGSVGGGAGRRACVGRARPRARKGDHHLPPKHARAKPTYSVQVTFCVCPGRARAPHACRDCGLSLPHSHNLLGYLAPLSDSHPPNIVSTALTL